MIPFDIIITASHIPSHPSTYLITTTIESLKYINYNGTEKINVYLSHDFSDNINYINYIDNLKKYCKNFNKNTLLFNLIIIKKDTHGNLVGNIRNCLKYVNNEYLLIIQHDFPFCKNFKIENILKDMIKYPMLKHIRFNKRNNFKQNWDFDKINYFNNYNIKANNNYISTTCWSDNNHLTRKSYYDNFIMKISEDGESMEFFLKKINKKKKINGNFLLYGTYIYGKIGETKYINHLDGKNFVL